MYKLCKPSLYFCHFGKAWKSPMLPCHITARNCTGFSDNRVNLFGTVHSALCVYYNVVNWFFLCCKTYCIFFTLSSGYYSVLPLVGGLLYKNNQSGFILLLYKYLKVIYLQQESVVLCTFFLKVYLHVGYMWLIVQLTVFSIILIHQS